MLILDGTIGSNISAFLARLNEEVLPCKIMLYAEWLATYSSHHCNDHHEHSHPKGIIYMRVMPEIALKRINVAHPEQNITLEYIQQVYQQKNEQFIENKNNPAALQSLPILVLNGNIDFQTDFSQFYNHLFYIKRFLQQIQEKEEMILGIYKEKAYRRCC
jgi:hypothetical protein